MLPAAAIIAVITVGTVLLSRKRDSLIHRMLGIAACWLCAYPLFGSSLLSEPEGLLVLALILVVFQVALVCGYTGNDYLRS